MKLFFKLSVLAFVILIAIAGCAQKNPLTDATTIILLRHAEKDTVNPKDPQLSGAGKQRAQKLANQFPGVKPDAFYATNFIRTKETIAQWSRISGKQIETYDAAKQTEFAEVLKSQKGKTIVVSGHSNTIPQLVNLLINQTKYSSLPDNEYSKIFIVTIAKDSTSEKLITY